MRDKNSISLKLIPTILTTLRLFTMLQKCYKERKKEWKELVHDVIMLYHISNVNISSYNLNGILSTVFFHCHFLWHDFKTFKFSD